MSLDRTGIRRGPAEGWLSLGLLLLAGYIVAWAVDDSAWVLSKEPLTAFLPWALCGGILAGFAVAELGWGRLRGHLAGALVAALVVPILVGRVLLPSEVNPATLFQATADSATQAFVDLVVQGHGSTQQYGHFLLVLGLVLWATGQFSAYAIYHHRRPLSAVIALGLAIVVNVGLTREPRDQIGLLVLFSIVALLLLVRLHSFEEREEWLKRRIGDPGPLASLTLRGGSAFVGLAVVGSLALTSVAKSAPLHDAWPSGTDPWLIQVGHTLQRYFSFLAPPRGPSGVDFGSVADIRYVWTTDGAVAVTIQRPSGDNTDYYWRAATYDEFLMTQWQATDAVQVARAAGADLLAGNAEGSQGQGRQAVTFTVTPSFPGGQIVAPNTPAQVSVPTTVSLIGGGGYIASIDGSRPGISYRVTSMYPVYGDADPKDITARKLIAAGTKYPPGMEPYLQVPDGAIGPDATKFREQVRAGLRGTTPYDWATAMVGALQDSGQFHYSADISDLDCSKIGVVECFARYRRGFCLYYASEMAILLRSEGIPTRLVQGFLPGARSGDTETVTNSDSHAWVEVYFPGYGWVDFNPTGGGVAQLAPIPTGRPVASPSASPQASSDEGGGKIPARVGGESAPAGSPGSSGGAGSPGTATYIALTLLLLAAVGWLAVVAYRRGPREVSPDGAWSSVTGLARRLGFGPRPNQTVYEYSQALGDLVPSVRPELQLVAQAKVEVAYGRRTLGPDRLRRLRTATGRLRVGLLRLVLHRPRRRRR